MYNENPKQDEVEFNEYNLNLLSSQISGVQHLAV